MHDRRQATLHPLRFNGSTSIITFPATPAVMLTGNQTYMVGIRPLGAGGGGNFGYVLCTANSTADGGIRFMTDDAGGAPRFTFGADSTGVNANPFISTAFNTVTYGDYHDIALTWTGGLTAASMTAFIGTNGKEIASSASATVGDGSVFVDQTADALTIGNRPGSARAYNGDLFYAAIWNRILRAEEMRLVQQEGPRAVPNEQYLCWFNGRDWSPNGFNPATVVAVTQGAHSPFAPVASIGRRRYAAFDVAAGGSVQPPRSMHQYRLRAA